jgi:hypothetical protein
MKNITKRELERIWREEIATIRHPERYLGESTDYCLRHLFRDRKHCVEDEIVSGLDFETLLGALLIARYVANRPFHSVPGMQEGPETMSAQRDACQTPRRVAGTVRAMVGPAPCPVCGRPIKRRRYWALWANVHCPCGVRMECVRQKPLTFVICRPNMPL